MIYAIRSPNQRLDMCYGQFHDHTVWRLLMTTSHYSGSMIECQSITSFDRFVYRREEVSQSFWTELIWIEQFIQSDTKISFPLLIFSITLRWNQSDCGWLGCNRRKWRINMCFTWCKSANYDQFGLYSRHQLCRRNDFREHDVRWLRKWGKGFVSGILICSDKSISVHYSKVSKLSILTLWALTHWKVL